MKRFVVETVDLPDDHPCWPNARVYKLRDTKVQKIRKGTHHQGKTDKMLAISLTCYTSPEEAQGYADRKNA